MPKLSRREFCLATSAALAAAACGPSHGNSDGGDMNAGIPTDLSGLYRSPDFACSTQPAGGPFTSFAVGQATFFRCPRLFIARDAGGVYALTSVCTHEACDVHFDSATASFPCPCHESVFDFNGAVTHAPATKPLVHYKATLDGSGNVVVDTSVVVDPATRLNEPGD